MPVTPASGRLSFTAQEARDPALAPRRPQAHSPVASTRYERGPFVVEEANRNGYRAVRGMR